MEDEGGKERKGEKTAQHECWYSCGKLGTFDVCRSNPKKPYATGPYAEVRIPGLCGSSPLIEAMFGATWSTRRVETQVRHLRAWFLPVTAVYWVAGVLSCESCARGMNSYYVSSVRLGGALGLGFTPWGCMSVGVSLEQLPHIHRPRSTPLEAPIFSWGTWQRSRLGGGVCA